MDIQIDRMPLKEFRKFLQFSIKQIEYKEGYILDGNEKLALIYSKKAGKEEEIMLYIKSGKGIPKYIISEKLERAEEIYKKLYGKFRASF